MRLNKRTIDLAAVLKYHIQSRCFLLKNGKLKRDFQSDKPLEKCVTDITEIKAKDGKLYVSAMFDCFDLTVLGLAMDTNMRA